MIGYGVSTTTNSPPPSFNQNDLLSPTNSNSIKKELTLAEKQAMASKLEKEFNEPLTSTSNQNGYNKDLMSNSMSLNNLKANDNKDFSYLTDLNFSSSNNSNKPNNQQQMNNSFSMSNNLNQSNMMMGFNNTNNGFNNNNNIRPAFNNNNNNQQQLNKQFSFNNNNSNNNSQLGFFGNLALPAPPTANANKNIPMNQMINKNVINMNNNSSGIPNLAPPPSINTTLKPTPALIPNTLNSNNNNNTSKPKTALDDLADIFG